MQTYRAQCRPVLTAIVAFGIMTSAAGAADGSPQSPRPRGPAADAAAVAAGGFGVGPDVVYSNINSVSAYGPVGGIRAYSLGSGTCNIGDENLRWGFSWQGSPGLAMNAYRLHNGRLMQIGMSFVKHSCCAAAGSGCGIPCNGQGGSFLGVGCKDTYSAGYNAGQGSLGPRSSINAFTGQFTGPPGGSGDAIFRRLQVRESDMSGVTYPGALYFVEGVYVGSDDAPEGNAYNNASYQRVLLGANFSMTLTGNIAGMVPAIYAWRDHGNGPDTPDPSVLIQPADVPGEGRFLIGSKVIDNGNGTWRYEYALYNLNSDRAASTLKVALPPGTTASAGGFHDCDYHSGEVYDNTNWSVTVGSSSIIWSSPATHISNPNGNALRWGMMDNFWFTANRPPVQGQATVQLFKPGIPDSISVAIYQPSSGCAADCAVPPNAVVEIADLLALLAQWNSSTAACDINDDGIVDLQDLLAMLAAWGAC